MSNFAAAQMGMLMDLGGQHLGAVVFAVRAAAEYPGDPQAAAAETRRLLVVHEGWTADAADAWLIAHREALGRVVAALKEEASRAGVSPAVMLALNQVKAGREWRRVQELFKRQKRFFDGVAPLLARLQEQGTDTPEALRLTVFAAPLARHGLALDESGWPALLLEDA